MKRTIWWTNWENSGFDITCVVEEGDGVHAARCEEVRIKRRNDGPNLTIAAMRAIHIGWAMRKAEAEVHHEQSFGKR